MSLLNPDDPFNPSPSNFSHETQRVVVTDVDMTIGTMCRFMVKWAIAAIPAALILFALWFVVTAIGFAILHSLQPPAPSLTNSLSAPPPPPPPQ